MRNSTITQPSIEQKKVFYSTMDKFTKSQKLKEKIIPYLLQYHPEILRNSNRKQRIRECCNMIAFRRYLET